MRMFSLALAAGLAAYVSGGDATAACKAGPDSLFEDQFGTLDDTWGRLRTMTSRAANW